jgi:hypothetical protein
MLADALRQLRHEIAPPDTAAFEAWLATLAWEQKDRDHAEFERWLDTIPAEDREVARADGPRRPPALDAPMHADAALLDAVAAVLPRLTADAALEHELPRLLLLLARDGGAAAEGAVLAAVARLADAGKPLPLILVDELPASAVARAVATALERKRAAGSDARAWAALRWADAPPIPWSVSVTLTDLAQSHPKRRHAVKLASELKLRVHADENASAWALSLRGALDDGPAAGFSPAYWGGYFAPGPADAPGAVVRATLEERPPVPPLRPKRKELSVTLETVPDLVAEIGALIGRPLLVGEAEVRVLAGETLRDDLCPPIRAWLARR